MLRVLLAVVAGYLTLAVLAVIGAIGLSAVFGGGDLAVPPPAFVVSMALFSTVAAAIGGYLCARLAPVGRVLIAIGLLFFFVLAIGVVLGRASATPTQPLWYQAVMTMLGASGVLIGAVIERSNAATRARGLDESARRV